MSAIDNTPVNKNFLSPLNFKFSIKRSPHVNFFIQKVNIPDIGLPPPVFANPMINIPLQGEHLKYGDLSITFKVDEDLQNYLEIHNWIRSLGKLHFSEYRSIEEKKIYTGEGLTSDISLMVLSSTKMPNYEIIFVDAHPISLTGLTFNTVDTDVKYIEATAAFKYTYFDINNI